VSGSTVQQSARFNTHPCTEPPTTRSSHVGTGRNRHGTPPISTQVQPSPP
jgi:hypothetical protein